MNGFDFLNFELFGNSLRAWLYALTIALAVFLGLRLLQPLLVRQIKGIRALTRNHWDDLLLNVLSVTKSWLLAAVALWAGALALDLSVRTFDVIVTLAVLAILAQVGIWGTTAITSYVKLYGERKLQDDAASVMTVRSLGFLASVGLWALVVLVFLENRGIDVTPLVAGLGIGGVAVALALQNILGDLFASLSIVLDKPFVIGDFIIVDNLLGTVQHVGLKTTRVQSLSGEQLVFANSDLLKSRIRNFQKMYERRVVFTFGVEYGTPLEQLEWIPTAVREIIEQLPDTRFDRAHFQSYGDSSLDFEVVYYVLQPDYNLYMDRQQSINLSLYRLFEERDVAFAFPTRTLHVVPANLARVG